MNSWFVRYAPGANSWALREDSGAYVIAPSVAAVAITGQTLTVSPGRALTPATAQVGVTTSAPAMLESDTARPTSAALTITGHTPAVGQSHVRAPTTGAVAVAGYAPTAGVSHAVAPAAGAVSAAGGTPALQFDFKRQPATGSATITGGAPEVWRSSPVFIPDTAQVGIASGYPEAALGSRKTITFPFATTAQGFVATPGAGTAMAWTGATGNPAGSLSTSTTGANRNSVNVWTLTTDWSSLGIPGNHIVTGIIAKGAQSRASVFTAGVTSQVFAVTLTPTGHPAVTIAEARNVTAAEAGWTAGTSADTTGLQINSSGSLTITLSSYLRTQNNVAAAVTLLQDNVTFVVTYTESRTLVPVSVTVSLAGFRPTLQYGATSTVNSWFPRLTDGYNTWGARFGAGSGSTLAPASALAAITAEAPTLLRGSPVITTVASSLGVEGFAPTMFGNPIHVVGADYWDSDPATLSGSSVRVVTQTNPVERPPVAALAFTGYAPTLVQRNIIVPLVAAPTIAGYAPTVARDYAVTTRVGAARLTGYAPLVNLGSPTITPATGRLSVTGHAPTFPERPVFRPETGQLQVLQSFGLAATPGAQIAQVAGDVSIAGHAPTLAYGVGVTVPASSLAITAGAVWVETFRAYRVTTTFAARPATLVGSGFVRKRFTATLQAQSPLLVSGTGTRQITGSGDWQAGRASFQGTLSSVEDTLQAEPARLFARVRQIEFHAEHRRMKPERVNRYTVALKPSPRFRVRPPNKRKPTR